jgi:oxygen-dependent protoporphyrinogen oxidase
MAWSDGMIVERTLDTLRRVFPDLDGVIEFAHVTRWPYALPLTHAGAYRLIGECGEALDPAHRIQFAGDYLSCAGQNTAVEFGTRAADNLRRHHGVQAST